MYGNVWRICMWILGLRRLSNDDDDYDNGDNGNSSLHS